MTNEEYKEYQELKRKEYNYLINDVLNDNLSCNQHLSFFYNYQPIKTNKILKRRDVFKKINSDYIKNLYVDKNYQFKINLNTNNSKFPKFFIKFENGYKRYGCISFYGHRTSWVQDYFFYSKNCGEFFLTKIRFKEAYAFSRKTGLLSKIKFTVDQILNNNDIDDIFVLVWAGDNHKWLEQLRKTKTLFFDFSAIVYDSLIPTHLDIYKNNQIIKKFDIRENHYRVNNNFIEIINSEKKIIERWNILKDTNE